MEPAILLVWVLDLSRHLRLRDQRGGAGRAAGHGPVRRPGARLRHGRGWRHRAGRPDRRRPACLRRELAQPSPGRGRRAAHFRFHKLFDRLQHPVQFFDAAGLGVFAVAGTKKALDYGINWPMAAVLGMISGIGGGMVRDVLTAQVPTVLRADIYAVAALAGALVVVAGSPTALPATAVAFTGITLCVFLRLMALYRGWKLPVAPSREL